jgi:hypothetical protein
MPTFIAFLILMVVLLSAGDLLAAARKPGRHGGRRAGRLGSRKGAPNHPSPAAAGVPEENPVPAAPADGGPEAGGGDAPAGRDDAGGTRPGGGDAGGTRPGGGDAGGPPEFPEAPAWGFPPGGDFLDELRTSADKRGRDNGAGPGLWELLRALYRASGGPCDPRALACMSRMALALTGEAGYLEAGAALAAGAVELFRLSVDDVAAEAGADTGGPHFLEEREFARKVLDASRASLSRSPGFPFPAPAYSVRTAMYAGTAPQSPSGAGPAELRSALAAAELDAAGSREALVIRSRLGEAVAEEEARARASVTTLTFGTSFPPGDAGPSRGSGDSPGSSAPEVPGEGSGEALLRSASEGLDALLGRTHPDSLDARERLARHLSGGSGHGIPPLPFADELPPPSRMLEAAKMFMETAAARAGAGRGPAPGKARGRPTCGTGRPRGSPRTWTGSLSGSGTRGTRGPSRPLRTQPAAPFSTAPARICRTCSRRRRTRQGTSWARTIRPRSGS